MSEFSKKLKEVRESLAMNKKDFADYVGTSPSNISRYEKNDMGVSIEAVKEIADKLNINAGYLLGWEKNKYKNSKDFKNIPLIGTIAAGLPVLATENIKSMQIVSEDADIDFCLEVKGDSMVGARIYDGDIVFIRKQDMVDDGEIAAVLIEDEATLKRFYRINGSIVLRAENPNYKDIIINKKDHKDIKILGKAIFFQSAIK